MSEKKKDSEKSEVQKKVMGFVEDNDISGISVVYEDGGTVFWCKDNPTRLQLISMAETEKEFVRIMQKNKAKSWAHGFQQTNSSSFDRSYYG